MQRNSHLLSCFAHKRQKLLRDAFLRMCDYMQCGHGVYLYDTSYHLRQIDDIVIGICRLFDVFPCCIAVSVRIPNILKILVSGVNTIESCITAYGKAFCYFVQI